MSIAVVRMPDVPPSHLDPAAHRVLHQVALLRMGRAASVACRVAEGALHAPAHAALLPPALLHGPLLHPPSVGPLHRFTRVWLHCTAAPVNTLQPACSAGLGVCSLRVQPVCADNSRVSSAAGSGAMSFMSARDHGSKIGGGGQASEQNQVRPWVFSRRMAVVKPKIGSPPTPTYGRQPEHTWPVGRVDSHSKHSTISHALGGGLHRATSGLVQPLTVRICCMARLRVGCEERVARITSQRRSTCLAQASVGLKHVFRLRSQPRCRVVLGRSRACRWRKP